MIITISKEMGYPSYIVLQKNGRYAEVVSFYNSRKKRVVVSIDFADIGKNYKYQQYMNGYYAGYYNIIVTEYEPDNLKSYLNGCQIIYDKAKMNGKYQVGSGRVVTFTHDTPFNANVAQGNSTVNKKFSERQRDQDYLAAVKHGDMEAAQKMVDEAAKEAGYTIKAYHGTDADAFTVYDKGKIGNASRVSILGDGFYFADKKSIAAQYGKNVFDVYLKQSNPYSATQDDAYKLKAVDMEKNGHDGVKLPTGKGNIFMVLDSEQIKSADPVTYDNDGNVIPLSERFNSGSNDIRYSDRQELWDRHSSCFLSG